MGKILSRTEIKGSGLLTHEETYTTYSKGLLGLFKRKTLGRVRRGKINLTINGSLSVEFSDKDSLVIDPSEAGRGVHCVVSGRGIGGDDTGYYIKVGVSLYFEKDFQFICFERLDNNTHLVYTGNLEIERELRGNKNNKEGIEFLS